MKERRKKRSKVATVRLLLASEIDANRNDAFCGDTSRIRIADDNVIKIASRIQASGSRKVKDTSAIISNSKILDCDFGASTNDLNIDVLLGRKVRRSPFDERRHVHLPHVLCV